MLSLRTAEGLDLKAFKRDFKEDLLRTKKEEIAKLKQLKMIDIKDDFLFITDEYFYVSNRIIVELM